MPAKTSKPAATIPAKATKPTAPAKTGRKKKTAAPCAEMVVVGPVALAEPVVDQPPVAETPSPAMVFESGTRLTGAGNAFDVSLSAGGELLVRYQDRARILGSTIQAILVSDPGPCETVAVAMLAFDGTVHCGPLQVSPQVESLALAFTGSGRWDSNGGRNYRINLRP